MPRKYVLYESDFPELSGERYLTRQEVADAEEIALKQRGAAEGKQQSAGAMQAIGKFGQTLQDYGAEERVSKSLGALPTPEPTEEGKPMAKGFFLNPEDATAMTRLGETKKQFGEEKPDLTTLARTTGITASAAPEAKEFMKNLPSGDLTQYGRSSVGAALAYTESHPEEVERARELINRLRGKTSADGTPIYNPELLAAYENQAGTDVRATQANLTDLMEPAAKRKDVLETTTPLEVKKAGQVKAASTAADIRTRSGLADVSAETAGTISEASTAAGERGRMNERYALAAQGKYDVSMEEGVKIGNAVQAINAMDRLAVMIEDGTLTLADVTPAGVFTNPQAKIDNEVAQEMYARPISGAAINEKEWSKFKGELGTGIWNLSTEDGRKAAANRLRDIARSNKQAVAVAVKDDNWFERIDKIGRVETGGGGKQAGDIDTLLDELLGQ